MKPGHILVGGNAIARRKELRRALAFEGHQVAETETADQTIREACSGRHDLLLLDSGMDGIGPSRLCRAIRPESDLGIIIMDSDDSGHSPSVHGSNAIDALSAGADDYVPTPFVVAELMARVRAILRRVKRSHGADHCIMLHDRAIDLESREVKGPDGMVSHLTPKEFLVLQYLVTHANKPRTHQSLAQTVWQRDGNGEVEYVRVVIKQLRGKLEPDPNNPRYILTERSVGYRFHLPTVA
jgi:two-component system KDP operon response regulator KdpE